MGTDASGLQGRRTYNSRERCSLTDSVENGPTEKPGTRQNRKSNTSLPIQSADARGNVPDLKKGSLHKAQEFLEASGAWKGRRLRGREQQDTASKKPGNRRQH